MTDIKVGDVVQLKSGGPMMTVEWIDTEEDEVECIRFETKGNNQELLRDTFNPATLINSLRKQDLTRSTVIEPDISKLDYGTGER